eukprot:3257633-Amphidinium_carterae.1
MIHHRFDSSRAAIMGLRKDLVEGELGLPETGIEVELFDASCPGSAHTPACDEFSLAVSLVICFVVSCGSCPLSCLDRLQGGHRLSPVTHCPQLAIWERERESDPFSSSDRMHYAREMPRGAFRPLLCETRIMALMWNLTRARSAQSYGSCVGAPDPSWHVIAVCQHIQFK